VDECSSDLGVDFIVQCCSRAEFCKNSAQSMPRKFLGYPVAGFRGGPKKNAAAFWIVDQILAPLDQIQSMFRVSYQPAVEVNSFDIRDGVGRRIHESGIADNDRQCRGA
jgi:hypothetical protein